MSDTSLDAVRERFSRLEPIFNVLSDKNRELNKWKDISEPGNARPNLFYTPGGFGLKIGSSALRMHHFIRFSTFIESAEERDLLHEFGRQLACLFGRRKALYSPCEGVGDQIIDWLTDGVSVTEMESRLRNLSCPPRTIEELANRSLPDLRYYVDNFEDC